jgi:hypothetical protein
MSARNRWWRFVRGGMVASGIVVVVGGLALGWYRVRNVREREAALERIRARGQPVLPEDLHWSARGNGVEPSDWLAAIRKLPSEEWSIANLPECTAELGKMDEDSLRMIYQSWITDPASLESPSACLTAMLRRGLENDAALMDLAQDVESFSGIDWAERFASAGLVGTSGPRLSIELGSVVDVLCRSALDCALKGLAQDAVQRLDLAWRAAALSDNCPCLFGALIWSSLGSKVVRATARIANLLPEDIDLTSFEDRMATLDVRTRWRSGLLGERALANRTFDSMRRGPSAVHELVADFGSTRSARELTIWLTLDHRQCVYLERIARAIDAVERWDASVSDASHASDGTEVGTWLLVPEISTVFQSAGIFEVLRDLARAALLARRAGAQAAIAWVTAQPDALGSSTLHAKLEDGVLRLWSVGENGRDDGGVACPPNEPDELPLDLVVCVRAR